MGKAMNVQLSGTGQHEGNGGTEQKGYLDKTDKSIGISRERPDQEVVAQDK